MRPLELLTVTSSVLYLLWVSFGTGLPTSPLRLVPFLSAGFLLAHLYFEGYRWHMIPAYVLVALTVLSYPLCYPHHFRIRLTYVAVGCAFAIILIAASVTLAGVLYPVFAFVPVTGRYPVGTYAMHLVDSSRADPYAPGHTVARELMVQFWYPAETTQGSAPPRYRDGRKDDWRTSNFPLVRTRSFTDAPVRHELGRLPVLIFSGPIDRFQNTFEVEELASHGFLVVALDHPYASNAVLFPDGRVIKQRAGSLLPDFRTDQSLKQSTLELNADLAVRVADAEFVITSLRKWRAPDPDNQLAGTIDSTRIGAFGHSFGGAVVAELCVRNPEIRAGINMDGSMFGRAKVEGIHQPFFFMLDCSERPTPAALRAADGEERRTAQALSDDFHDVEHSLAQHGGYFMRTPGLEHMNFSDVPLFSLVKAQTGAGTVDLRTAHSMINGLSLAFFRTYLLGAPEQEIMTAAAMFPETQFYRSAPVAVSVPVTRGARGSNE